MKRFFSLTLLGGATVLLPIVLFLLLMQWLVAFLAGFTEPVILLLTGEPQSNDFLTVLMALSLIIGSSFLIGLLIRTRVGGWLNRWMDRLLVRIAPGYRTIRDLVAQILGGSRDSNLLGGTPVLARIYGPDSPVSVTAIVTSRHENGWITVFVPTAPLPTSGLTYHLPPECIEPLSGVTVEEAMRTIVACGAGSADLFARQKRPVLTEE